MLPCAPAVTTRALVAEIGAALGRPIKLARVPPVVLAVLGLFVPIIRELREMSYPWEEPFVVDDAQFGRRFGDLATTIQEGARATATWALAAYGRS